MYTNVGALDAAYLYKTRNLITTCDSKGKEENKTILFIKQITKF